MTVLQELSTINELRVFVTESRRQAKSIGLVPTMGYLHRGHESLIAAAAAENDLVIVSIYVNPTQFGPGEDFERYPRDPERDLVTVMKTGAQAVFVP